MIYHVIHISFNAFKFSIVYKFLEGKCLRGCGMHLSMDGKPPTNGVKKIKEILNLNLFTLLSKFNLK
jgi:hypothetical protein